MKKKYEVAVKHQLITSMNEFMNGWYELLDIQNDICGQYAQCVSSTQNSFIGN